MQIDTHGALRFVASQIDDIEDDDFEKDMGPTGIAVVVSRGGSVFWAFVHGCIHHIVYFVIAFFMTRVNNLTWYFSSSFFSFFASIN